METMYVSHSHCWCPIIMIIIFFLFALQTYLEKSLQSGILERVGRVTVNTAIFSVLTFLEGGSGVDHDLYGFAVQGHRVFSRNL